MAKKSGVPQLENGFARVANEILEAIARTSLSDHESRFIHFLWRKTYGWHNKGGESKKLDSISHGQWATGTSVPRRHVSRVLDRLVKRNVFVKIVNYQRGKKVILWGFQKRYHDWLTPLFEPPESFPDVQLPPAVATARHVLPPVEGAKLPSDVQLPPGEDQLPPVEGAKLPPVEGATKDNKDTTKDIINIIPPTALETGILSVFRKLEGWEFNKEEDLEWLRDFLRDNPETGLGDIKGCRDWYSKKPPPKNKGPWKVRLRNWMDMKKKRASGYRRPGKVPTTDELKEQAIRKGVV